MTGQDVPGIPGARIFPPAPGGFDPRVATRTDLARHGLPQRPDPGTQPELAALWEERAAHYQNYEHLEPELIAADTSTAPADAAARLGLFPLETCGYELTSLAAPFVMVTGKWTVPNLKHSPGAGPPNDFRTFFGLGFLDVHVEMTVDSAQVVTARIRIHDGTQVALPVNPGDSISAVLCLDSTPAASASYFLTNETALQSVNLQVDTGFPPAVTVNAGISRGRVGGPPGPLARFGVVLFEELLAFTTSGTRFLTDGVPTTMVDSAGSTIASPIRLNESTFKVTRQGT